MARLELSGAMLVLPFGCSFGNVLPTHVHEAFPSPFGIRP